MKGGLDMILETERLSLRKLEQADFPALRAILQDREVMYAYEHPFSNREVQAWLNRQLSRYERDGFGLWAMVEKATGEVIGQCGLTMQEWLERTVPEIGYLLRRDRWHQGFATEAALACREYAFGPLGLTEVFSIIRDSNFASQRVALRCGMSVRGSFVKHYYGMDMLHLVFGVRKGAAR